MSVARWIEPGNLWDSGTAKGEAIESLREEIHTVWQDLDRAADAELTRNTDVALSIASLSPGSVAAPRLSRAFETKLGIPLSGKASIGLVHARRQEALPGHYAEGA